MKSCHACGQKLPIKVGDVVEGAVSLFGKPRRGLVSNSSSVCIVITEFVTGELVTLRRSTCVRLHGYYRITERETL